MSTIDLICYSRFVARKAHTALFASPLFKGAMITIKNNAVTIDDPTHNSPMLCALVASYLAAENRLGLEGKSECIQFWDEATKQPVGMITWWHTKGHVPEVRLA